MTSAPNTENFYIIGPRKGVDHIRVGQVEKLIIKTFNKATVESRSLRCITFDFGHCVDPQDIKKAVQEAFGDDVLVVRQNTALPL